MWHHGKDRVKFLLALILSLKDLINTSGRRMIVLCILLLASIICRGQDGGKDWPANVDYVYGISCGYSGGPPPLRALLVEIVSKDDIVELEKWLKSSLAEQRVYAVEGFYNLKQAGLKLNPEQMILIKEIKKDKGMINYCSGCKLSSIPIQKVVRKFTF